MGAVVVGIEFAVVVVLVGVVFVIIVVVVVVVVVHSTRALVLNLPL